MGNDAFILTPGEDAIDFLGNKVIGIYNRALSIASSLKNSNNRSISALGFYLFQFIFAVCALMELKKNSIPGLILTRSPIVAYFVTSVTAWRTGTILELHHLPGNLERLLINKLDKGVSLVVSNSGFGMQLKQKGVIKSFDLVANAAPASFHNLNRIPHQYSLPLVVGYAGKSSSSGHDNGLSIAIELLENYPDLVGKIKFKFIGCEESFQSKVKESMARNSINPDSITLISHLPHNLLIDEIAKFDLALIPYPDELYYERSFPIKIAEMASAGIPMIVSNTKAHRRILGEPNEFYYTPGSYVSLHQTIKRILENMELISSERIRIILLSQKFTYAEKAVELLKIGSQ